jgi:predicted dehydrogenase
MTDTIDIALVGGGTRGRTHAENVRTIREQTYLLTGTDRGYPDTVYERHASERPSWTRDVSNLAPRVTGVFSPSADSRAALAEESATDPTRYETLDALLADLDEFDAVVVASPTDAHLDAALPVLDADTHLLVEKPVGLSLADHDRFIAAADDADATAYVGFNLRTAPYYRRIKDLLADGAVGELGMLSCHECRGPFDVGYTWDVERSGGTLLEKNCHDFDLFNWYTEADPVAVSAFGDQHVFDEGTELVDSATVTVQYDNDVMGTLEISLYSPFDQRTRKYELRGSEGLLRSPEQEGEIELFTRNGHDRIGDEHGYDAGNDFVHGEADVLELHRFLECVRGNDEPPASPRDAKKSAAIAIAAQESIETGETVELDDEYDLVE